MSETVNQGNATANQNTGEQSGGEEKTFTQAELDRIINERLQRDRAKYADYEALKEKAGKFDQLEENQKSELQKATDRAASLQAELDKLKKANEVRVIREKVAAAKKVPVGLLTGDSEEACTQQADAILAFAGQSGQTGYPGIRDAGETRVTGKKSTAEQFADWANQAFNI
jgi:vacuolar-type H+-ATPase subunit I/STV1